MNVSRILGTYQSPDEKGTLFAVKVPSALNHQLCELQLLSFCKAKIRINLK